jgi:hypothetical protein
MLRSFMRAARIMNTVARSQSCVVHRGMSTNHRSLALLSSSRGSLLGARLHAGFATQGAYSRSAQAQMPPSAYQTQNDNQPSAVIDEVDFDTNAVNAVTLVGVLGRKPDIKYFETGKKVASASIALKGAKDAETQWYVDALKAVTCFCWLIHC